MSSTRTYIEEVGLGLIVDDLRRPASGRLSLRCGASHGGRRSHRRLVDGVHRRTVGAHPSVQEHDRHVRLGGAEQARRGAHEEHQGADDERAVRHHFNGARLGEGR